MQSHTEVLDFLSRNPPASSPEHAIPVLSISPQSLASLAASISSTTTAPIPLHRILARVRAFALQKLAIEHVFDTTFARALALREHIAEFNERKSAPDTLPMLAGACPGWVCYAEKAHPEMLPFISRTKSPQQVMGTLIKTWMGAKCQKSYVPSSPPSSRKSNSCGDRPDKMYHITVMPCYDKKLEASRSDFYNEQYATRDVDCVLTTGELQRMMLEAEFDIHSPVPGEDDLFPKNFLDVPDLVQEPGSSSGSYLQSLITSLSSPSSSSSSSSSSLITHSKRIRSDYEEYTVRNTETGEIVFKGATCYGFRNLQNLVRKVGRQAGLGAGRTAKSKSSGGVSLRAVARRRKAATVDVKEVEVGEDRGYDYVEVMACPGGCVNGGGQLKAPPSSSSSIDEEGFTRTWPAPAPLTTDSSLQPQTPTPISDGSEPPNMMASERWGDKTFLKRVEAAYWNVHGLDTPPPSPPPSSSVLVDRVLAGLGGEVLRTEYHAVVSEVVGLAVKW